MKFSNVFALGLASLAIASPTPVQQEKKDFNSDLSKLDSTASAIVSDVQKLLQTISTDVESLASAAGINATEIFSLPSGFALPTGLSLPSGIPTAIPTSIPTDLPFPFKRGEDGSLEARDDAAVQAAASKLITDIITGLSDLATTTGVNLVGSLLSNFGL